MVRREIPQNVSNLTDNVGRWRCMANNFSRSLESRLTVGADRLPKYALHKPSGRAVVYFDRQPIYLGRHGSPESYERYWQLLADYGAVRQRRVRILPATESVSVALLVEQFAKRLLALELLEKVREPLDVIIVDGFDMRLVRLGRTFSAIISLGGVVTYALGDDELDGTLQTLAVHAREGSLLVFDLPNAASFLQGGQAKTEFEFIIDTVEFSARAQVYNEFDRPNQLLIRRRLWTLSDGSTANDFCRYRMLFPAELTHRLRQFGFHVVDRFDNKDLRATDLSGITLYVVAKFCGESNLSGNRQKSVNLPAPSGV
jgi:hypothetical protein